MTEKLPTTTYIFVDRRKTGRGKSIPNRQRLLRRIKDAVRAAKPEDIAAQGIKNMTNGTPAVNPIKVTQDRLHEPTFHYAPSTGNQEVVLIGNDHWQRNDNWPISNNSGKGGSGSGSGEDPGNGNGDGEDDFVVEISRDEYLQVFFEDCELPDLQSTATKDLPHAVPKHAGYQKTGNPGQLSVKRSYKNSLPRRMALTRSAREELLELEEEYKDLLFGFSDSSDIHIRMAEIEARMKELRQKISNTPFFEQMDLRYTNKELVFEKSADAVFIMIMDISGSMDEDKKRMARKFFSLQYAFIHRKYPNTDLVFIAHTEKAQEMTEEEFFSTRKSGGTMVSPAYALAHDIIKERYNANETNLYLSQASDGDNWDSDNVNCIKELEQSGLIDKLRHMSYAQVGESYGGYSIVNLWSTIASLRLKKISMVKIMNDTAVFDAFRQIYQTKTSVNS
jgi:uncharacterized sporulation protein YeaH/YhbH (DUF444 family)